MAQSVIRRGQTVNIEYLVTGAAGVAIAVWYMARDPHTASDTHDLDVSSDDGQITFANQGPDLLAVVHLTAEETEALPLGPRHAELWLTAQDDSEYLAAANTIHIRDSLRH
jgi:hypothetical protein